MCAALRLSLEDPIVQVYKSLFQLQCFYGLSVNHGEMVNNTIISLFNNIRLQMLITLLARVCVSLFLWHI